MSPALQAKLLRVLQEREFERVGDSHTIKIDVRVIAATHSDLARMVADGIVSRGSLLPAERDSGEAARAARTSRRHSAPRPALPAEAVGRARARAARRCRRKGLRRLMAYHWPGNVRQLENVVERAIAFSQGRPQVEVQDLTSEVDPTPAPSRVGGRRDSRMTASTSSTTSRASSCRSSSSRSNARTATSARPRSC